MGKSSYFSGQPVITQLFELIPEETISALSRKYEADRYYKTFLVRDHLLTMLYAAYFQCTSLREITTGLKANASKFKHLGLKNAPKKSTLSDANKKRPLEFFSELYHSLYLKYFSPDSRDEDDLFIIDSTTIKLFSSIMHGAGPATRDGKKKGGAKAHMIVDAKHDIPAFILLTEAKEHDLVFLQNVEVPSGATVVMDKAYTNYQVFNNWGHRDIKWVTRLKVDAYITEKEDLQVSTEHSKSGVKRDRLARLGRPSNQRITQLTEVRIIDYYDHEKKRTFSFITNDLERTPIEIANLYKRRWQIEILFKRIKQRYPLKYFLGENPNAIQIQIWTALICDLLVKIIQREVNNKVKKNWAYATISSMIKHHLMSYINLIQFLMDPDRLPTETSIRENQLHLFSTSSP